MPARRADRGLQHEVCRVTLRVCVLVFILEGACFISESFKLQSSWCGLKLGLGVTDSKINVAH